MIETGKQATKAIKRIKKLTGWTRAEIGRRLGVSRQSVTLIEVGRTKNPNSELMAGIDELLTKAESLSA